MTFPAGSPIAMEPAGRVQEGCEVYTPENIQKGKIICSLVNQDFWGYVTF